MGQQKTLRQLLSEFWFGAPKKAMLDLHPELRDREPLMRTRGLEMWVTQEYPYKAAVVDHAANVWMAKAVKLISDAIAPLALQVMQDGKPVKTDVPLLVQPNGTQAGADIWRAWAVSMLLGGECGLEVVKGADGKTFLEWWDRTPDVFQVVPDPARQRYGGVAGYIIDDSNGDPYALPPAEFIHFKFHNPRDKWRGLSPFMAARMSMKIDRHAREWAKDFFENSARPDFAVLAPEGTTKTERDELLASVLAMYRGTQNGAIVLESGVTDIKPLSFSPKDINFVEQREMSRDEVAAAAGIPDILMGFGNDSYDTPDKRINAEATMWSLTIKPLVDYRDQVLTKFYRDARLITETQEIKSDISSISALKGDYTTKLQQAMLMNGLNVPFNTIDKVLELGIGQIPGGETGAQDRANPLDGFSLPVGNDTLPKQIEGGIRIITPKAKGLVIPKGNAVEFGSALHRDLWELSIKRTDPYEKRFARVAEQLFKEQQDAVLAAVRREAKSISGLGDDPFDEEEWGGIFAKRTLPEYRRILAGAGNSALDDVGAGISFDLLDQRVIGALRRLSQRFARRVNETTWRALKDALAAGLEAGEGADKLAARVEQVMTLRIEQSSGAIARTETMSAFSTGTIEGWRQSGAVQQKMWVATFNNRVRDTHAEAHGQTVGLDEDFTVGTATGQGPGLMDEAGEAINCRCSVIAVQE